MNNTYLDKKRILSQSVLGFEFEFFSEMTRKEISEDLGKFLGKKIHVSSTYHSKFKPTSDIFKVEPDYSGGEKMVELITGPMKYDEAMIVLSRVLSWIRDNGWTTEKCAFQFNLSFDEGILKHKNKVSQIDKLRFILGLNEDFIYERFGNRRHNLYARSVRDLTPINKFMMTEKVNSVDSKLFKLPSTKYYGINFSKITQDYFEVRYLGGRGYEKKSREIQEIIDYIILYTHDVLSGQLAYSAEEVEKLNDMLKRHRKMIQSFSNYDIFKVNYPNLILLVNLKGDYETVKSMFPIIRDKLYEIIFESNINNGVLNYDSDNGRYQIKEAKATQCWSLEKIDLVDCEITYGNLHGCRLINTKISECMLDECSLMGSVNVEKSKLIKCVLNPGNKVIDSFVDSRFNTINCEVEGGILRSGWIGNAAKISNSTEITKDRSWDYTLPRNPAKLYKFTDENVKEEDIAFKDDNEIKNILFNRDDRSGTNKGSSR